MKNSELSIFPDSRKKREILLKMKFTLILLLVGLLQISAESYSQATKLSFEVKDQQVVDILREIEERSEFRFFYQREQVDVERRVSFKVEEQTIDEILNSLFLGNEIDYKIYADKLILIAPKYVLAEFSERNFQPNMVTGSVTDETGMTLAGVTVLIKGTTRGTVTDSNGNYSLSDIPVDATLVFSFVGMKTQEIEVEGRQVINIVMIEETITLEEVVAIGYGTQKKVNLTGSVSTATSERLEKRPIASVGQGLQGVIPNLNVSIDDGDPTTATSFNIRGFESITGGSPLILVDGVPMNLDQINPYDITSVTVLKDASASAVYGARAAFGVILVETKKGSESKISVTLSTEQSLAKPIFFMDFVTDPYLAATARNEAFKRTQGFNLWGYTDEYLQAVKYYSENPTEENLWGVVDGVLQFYGVNNYQEKLITNFAPQQKYDLSVSGGSKTSTYFLSFGALNKDGYLSVSDKNQNYKRYNVLMKADFQVTEWLNLDERITFNLEDSNKPHFYFWGCDINTAVMMSQSEPLQFPDLPYYIEPGDHEKFEPYIGRYFGGNNWFPYLKQGGRETWTNNDIWFNQGATLTPFEGFKIRGDFSYNTYWRDYQDVASQVEVLFHQRDRNLLDLNFIDYGWSSDEWILNQFNRKQYYVLNAYAEYELKNYVNHYLKMMIGYNQENGRNNSITAKAYDLITTSITDINATSGNQETSGFKNQVALRGIFYRLNYIYKDKYLFETSGRYDGTSRFPKDNRFGFFPSFSVGWRISSESFMEWSRNWLDNLKLRASYGELGNQLLGNNYYPYISTMEPGMSSYIMSNSGRIPYVSAPGVVSPVLTWETVATQNLGLDLIILKQRLEVSFDAYLRDTKDMLMSVRYPDLLGTTAPKANAADLRTKGWEMSLIWRDRIGKNINYGIQLALSDNQTEITKYENPSGDLAYNENEGSLSEYYEGMKIGEIWGFETVGIFQYDEDVAVAPDQSQIGNNWMAGDMQYADLNGDGKITRGSQTLDDPGDLKIIGNSSPRYSFGINPYITYKNLSLNIFFQGLFRDYLPSNYNYGIFYPFNGRQVETYFITESWSEDNRDAYFAAPNLATKDKKNILPQSRYVQNAAYIRLKNLTVNYNLPARWINKIGINKLEVYFSGMNLWEYSKIHKPLDPEVVTFVQEYYKQRIYALGAKITF